MSTRLVDVARAVLYEGYSLYPYRASSVKNQRRWPLGALYPPAFCARAQANDRHRAQVELIVRGPASARMSASARFLSFGPEAADTQEHELSIPAADLLSLGGGGDTITRELRGIVAGVAWRAVRVEREVHRVTIRVSNETGGAGLVSREQAVGKAMASAHVAVSCEGAELVSLVDPPEELRSHVQLCKHEGLWPALIDAHSVLAAPIILPDHPEVADESPGDLFDLTEIDEILSLRILTMTEAEQREAAADPRVAELIARTHRLAPEQLSQLHGRLRIAGPLSGKFSVGDRVRIRPRGRADAFDLVLAGHTATVSVVEETLEGELLIGVTADIDPGRDLGELGLPGHRFFFRPEELEQP